MTIAYQNRLYKGEDIQTTFKTKHRNNKRKKSVKKYCSKCGRPLIDSHCPVHLLDMVPVDKDANVVIEFKKLKGIGD